MPTSSPYAPAPPTTSGLTVTVDAFLNNSPMVQRALEALTYQRFLTDYIYREGERTTSGAVLYQQLLEGDLFTSRDAQEIEELAEFPVLNVEERGFTVAQVKKWGGAVLYSYEKRRRDRRDLLARDLRKLANTTVKKVNRVGIGVLNADPNVQVHTAPAAWSDTTNGVPVDDIIRASSLVEDIELGYEADTVLIHPNDKLDLWAYLRRNNMLPREATPNNNPLLANDLSGFLGKEWIVTRNVAEGTVWVVSRQMVGSYHDELPFYSRVLDLPEREGTLLQAARVTVPTVTDPKAAAKITGV